jgi:penicillin-binding protein A
MEGCAMRNSVLHRRAGAMALAVGVLSLVTACTPLGGLPTSSSTTASVSTETPTATIPPLPTPIATVTASPTPIISAGCTPANQGQRGSILDRNGVQLAYSVKDPLSPGGWRRRYPYPSLSNIIGYFSPVYGVTGLEAYYNAVLSGQSAEDCGATIYLAIDARIQNELDSQFQNQVVAGACPASNTGSIIAEDPRSGQILGMVSHPGFNADTLGNFSPAPDNAKTTVSAEYWAKLLADTSGSLLNRPLQGLYPPGSSFKTFTLLTGIDSGKYTNASTFSQADATTYTVNGFTINSNNLDAYTGGPQPPTFPLNLQHAFAYSDNVVFARVGNGIGADILTSYAAKFGLSTPDNVYPVPIDTDTGMTSPSYLYQSGSLDPVSLAVTAFGQGQLFLTPLTMLMIDSAVANNGLLEAPRFLLKVVPPGTPASSVANNAPVSLGQVISGNTASAVRTAMRDVVKYGSVGASPSPMADVQYSLTHIGGKTGTAQLASGTPHAWFISLAPDDAWGYGDGPARIALVIMKERGGEGACQSALAQKIIEYSLPLIAK